MSTQNPNENGKAQHLSSVAHNPFSQTFFHGTKADLKMGDEIRPGFPCNYTDRELSHVYVASTLTAAIWGAELALGEGRERIYLVEATGQIEDDPNVTDKKFPGNPTMSYRSVHPFKVIGEVTAWQSHSPEQVQAMKTNLQKLKDNGVDLIID
ncbi:MAG: NAD(+)--rifampin ADP-ribosyltransferase [Chitinophagaceae bacterium]